MDIPGFDADDPRMEQLREMLSKMGITIGPDGTPDMNSMSRVVEAMMRQHQTQMAGFGATDPSGVNWGFVSSIARRALKPGPETGWPTSGELNDAVGLADLWLDDEISFGRISSNWVGWNRQDWVGHTLAAWKELVQPLMTSLGNEWQSLTANTADTTLTIWRPMLRAASGALLGGALGQALGQLASGALSAGDIGLPLTSQPLVALVLPNIAEFAAGLEQPKSDVYLFLAIRESARQRLFGATPWLGPQLLAMVNHYASEIRIDAESLRDAVSGQLDGLRAEDASDQERMEAFRTVFVPTRTPTQNEVLERLETLLALIEGWVDEVTSRVTTSRMPAAEALTEVLRRRRAAGGPAESAMKTLFGAELSPRRTRDAANLWAATRAKRGHAERDAAWLHPDMLPTATDLDDPLDYAAQGSVISGDSFDKELADFLDSAGPDGLTGPDAQG